MNARQLEKVKKGDFFLLPYYSKWVGIIPILLGAILFFTKGLQNIVNPHIAVDVCGHLILLGYLLVILSKEKVDNHFYLPLRHKAMAYSINLTMILVITLPFFNFISSSLLQWEWVSYFTNFGVFSIFIFQIIYLMTYWRFKQEL
jgi:hypothetical protein